MGLYPQKLKTSELFIITPLMAREPKVPIPEEQARGRKDAHLAAI